jgi:hypothetical protein
MRAVYIDILVRSCADVADRLEGVVGDGGRVQLLPAHVRGRGWPSVVRVLDTFYNVPRAGTRASLTPWIRLPQGVAIV